MDVIINQIISNINYEEFQKRYSVFGIKADDCNDNLANYIIKCGEKAKSVYYSNGKWMHVLFDKGDMNIDTLKQSISDDKVIVCEAKYSDDYKTVLLNLLLNSLSNYDNQFLSFNNITGKLFIFNPDDKRTTKVEALKVEIKAKNEKYLVVVSTVSFIKHRYVNGDTSGKYYVQTSKKALRIALDSDMDTQSILFEKGNYKGRKGGTRFYQLLGLDRATTYQKVLNDLQDKYKDILDVSYRIVSGEIINHILKGTTNPEYMIAPIMNNKIHLLSNIDVDNDRLFEKQEIESIIDWTFTEFKKMNIKITKSLYVKKEDLIIMISHNKDYYKNNETDPYSKMKRSNPTQCITIEELKKMYKANELDKNKINVVLKELAIKKDVYNGKVSVDDWKSRNKCDYLFGTYDKTDNELITMLLNSNGDISFDEDNRSRLSPKEVETIKQQLKDSKCDFFIKDTNGNFNTVTTTDIIVLPNRIVTKYKAKNVKYFRDYFSGVFDIHTYNIDDCFYYSIGGKQNPSFGNIDKATHLYKVNQYGGKNLIIDLIDTMAVDFVKYGSYTVYPFPVKYLREYVLL